MLSKKRKLETLEQSNEMDEKWNKLFESVWKNIYINRLIFEHIRIFKNNERVVFDQLNKLKEYPERNYIDKIIYIGKDTLKKGDLPIEGVLKDITIHYENEIPIKGDAIPDGVKILKFGYNSNIKSLITPPISTLPKSIHTIKEVIIIKNSNGEYEIPSNIKSVSFNKCLNISGDNKSGNGFISIPNTVKELEFGNKWNNEDIPLKIGDLPIGLTKLTLYGYKQFYVMKQKDIFPSTLKELTVRCVDEEKMDNVFNILPYGIESLELIDYSRTIKPQSNLNKLKSLKKLSIEFSGDGGDGNDIEPFSLPSSLTDLSISNLSSYEIEPNTIPNSVISLSLNVESDITKDSLPDSITSLVFNRAVKILPPFLTHLEITDRNCEEDEMNSMISIFPSTLKSIKLNSCLKDLEIKYPSTVTVEYDDY